MGRPKVLIDSSFLYVLFHQQDQDHERVTQVYQSGSFDFVIPQVVLTEAAWLFNRIGGAPLAATFLELLAAAQPPIEPVTYADMRDFGILRKDDGDYLTIVP